MTLKRLLDEVFEGYDQDFVGTLYDETGAEMKTASNCGDTLALYILRQMADCCDDRNNVTVAELTEMQEVLETAMGQLSDVCETIALQIEKAEEGSQKGTSHD